MWFALILAVVCTLPFALERMRRPVSDAQRRTASGQFATLSQGVTHYEWQGPKDGPVALCIHGLSTSSYVWRGLTKGLVLMGYRVLVYDHFGRGLSDTAGGTQDSTFFIRQITDLLTHEKVDTPLTVFGYSMGGAIATHFAAAYPGKIKHLVLIAPAGMQNIGGASLKFVRDWPVIGDWLFLLTYPMTLRKGIKAEAHLPGSVEGINALQLAETQRRGYFPALLSSLRGILGDTARDQHKKLSVAGVPVLAVWADADDVIPLSGKDHLTDWNPQAQHAVIADAGHGVTYTHTDQVLKAIRAATT